MLFSLSANNMNNKRFKQDKNSLKFLNQLRLVSWLIRIGNVWTHASKLEMGKRSSVNLAVAPMIHAEQ